MRYTMRKSHYMEGHEPEMLCIYLNPDQAILLYAFGMNCTYACLALAHFGIAPHSIHIMLCHLDDICDVFEQLHIIPPFQQNETFYEMRNERDREKAAQAATPEP